ncbi:MAG TPA: HRDC domain-containing protein [Acidimicrobiales bacterium]|nr:HRDC domain-containing protein [Acidimicrobiales bacterium]
MAQSVAAWRERRAAQVDRPVRHVLPDLAVVAMAERPPRTPADLRRVRGLDGRHLPGEVAAEVLAAVATGRSLAEEDLQLPPRDGSDPDHRPAVALASAYVGQLARDEHLDASLLATRADIEALVRGDGTSRLLDGWRKDLAGAPVERLLAGELALAFAGRGSLVLEARSHRPPPAA